MTTIYEGEIKGKGKKIGIIASRFNEEITQRLLNGCLKELSARGVKKNNIILVWVPGAFEIPFAAQLMTRKKKIDGIVALGAVIRGETAHFDYVCEGMVQGILDVELSSRVPVSFGVLTTETDKQAVDRSGGRSGNKGKEAAEVILKLISLKDKIKK